MDLRAAPLLLLLLGCGGPDAPPPAPTVAPAAPRAPAGPPGPGAADKATQKAPMWSPGARAAEAALLRWADTHDPARLAEAQAALERSVAERPAETFSWHLLAWVRRQAGDAAGAEEALGHADPQRIAAFRYLFDAPPDGVLGNVRRHVWEMCKLEQGAQACGAEPPRRPEYPVWEQVAWASHGTDRLTQWVGARSQPTMASFLAEVGVRPGLRVADVGAGEGYFTLPIARLVGPSGKVWATEIDPAYTAFIDFAAASEGLEHVDTVVQGLTDVKLPEGQVDLVLLCEVFKALTTNAQARDPAHVSASVSPFLQSVRRSLAPGGRFVIVDHDAPEAEERSVSVSTMRRLVEAEGFRFRSRSDAFGPVQAILVFELP